MIPNDKVHNANYEQGISDAVLSLQEWFKEKTGGYTFKLNDPIVEVYYGQQSSSWYSETVNGEDSEFYYWQNVYRELAEDGGIAFPDSNYVWVIYCDTEGAGGGNRGIAILPKEDMEGLVGNTNQPISRWIGGLGHEMGHAFGLPDIKAPDNALMWLGYIIYPNAVFLSDEIETLKKSKFFFKE